MNKRRIMYTIITFLLSIAFVFASMVAMDKLLELKGSRILSEKGHIESKEQGMIWHDMLADSLYNQKEQLEEVESVIESFNNNDNEIELEPDAGHISKEKAIETSMMWINDMKIADYFSESGWLGNTNASLVSRIPDITEQNITIEGTSGEEEKKAAAEPEKGFWLVEFTGDISDIKLYVNAVKNSVWNAEIILKETSIQSADDVDRFIELTGNEMLSQFVESTGIVMLDQGENMGLLGINESSANTSEIVYEDNGCYAVTRIGYDSDIYARMDISIEPYDETAGAEISGGHIKITYSLQL